MPLCTPRSSVSTCREGRSCTPRSSVSTCREGRSCTPRRRFSACREGKSCTPCSRVSACRGGRDCTPRSCVSACREGRGCTPGRCFSPSRAGTACTRYSSVSPSHAGRGRTPCTGVSASRGSTGSDPISSLTRSLRLSARVCPRTPERRIVVLTTFREYRLGAFCCCFFATSKTRPSVTRPCAPLRDDERRGETFLAHRASAMAVFGGNDRGCAPWDGSSCIAGRVRKDRGIGGA